MKKCFYCEKETEDCLVIRDMTFCCGSCYDKYKESLHILNTPSKEVNKDIYVNALEKFEKQEFNYKKEIIKLNTKHTFKHCRKLSADIYKNHKEFKFFITQQISKKGKITNKHYEYKRKIALIRLYQKSTEEGGMINKICFVDDPIPKGYNLVSEYSKSYFFYDFICGDNQYIVLSEDKLECEEYKIEGMVVHINNHNQITKDCKLNQKMPLLMISSIKTSKIIFGSAEECMKKADELNIDEDNFFNYLYSNRGKSFRQPKWYETFMGSMLFSGTIDGYKNHSLVIGQPETGKTQSLLAVYNKFGEPQAHTSGSNSTMKGLIPSFNSQPIKMGALINSVRFHAIDEFLRILNKDDESNRRIVLGQLNSLYDNIMERFESGNGSAEGRMNCKVFAVSNPVYGTSDMEKMSHWLDQAFLSRNIIYFQSNEHIEAIKSGKLLEKHHFNIKSEEFLAFFDYFNSFECKFDEQQVKLLYEKYGEFLVPNFDVEGNNTYDHYRNRQFHHICCILDGIIKLRCLFDRDLEFVAKPVDYQTLSLVWHKIISSWDYQRSVDFVDILTLNPKIIVGGKGV